MFVGDFSASRFKRQVAPDRRQVECLARASLTSPISAAKLPLHNIAGKIHGDIAQVPFGCNRGEPPQTRPATLQTALRQAPQSFRLFMEVMSVARSHRDGGTTKVYEGVSPTLDGEVYSQQFNAVQLVQSLDICSTTSITDQRQCLR